MERTKFMQAIMVKTYSGVAIEAITGGFAGSWERCIARQLEREVKANHSEAIEIVQSVGNDYLKAAYLITGTEAKTESYATPAL